MNAPVTLVVVSWNTRELLCACLESLRPDAENGLVDVWVVDNGSTDGSREAVRERFGWVTLECPDSNLGFGAAVNLVAARTEAPWLVAANADTAVEPGAVRALVEAAERHPQAGLLAPRLVLPDGSTQHSVHPFPSIGVSLLLGTTPWRLWPRLGDRLCLEGAWDADRERAVPWAHGAFLMARRPLFDRIGRFDERQWMYAEDMDLAWRVRAAGCATVYVPGARVRHQAGAAAGQAFGDRVRRRHTAASYAWLRRRRGRAVATLFALANVLGAAGVAARALAGRRRPELADARSWLGLHARALKGRGALEP